MNAKRDDITLTVRIPRDLHAQVAQLAERDDRSLSSEVVRLLRYAVPVAERGPI